MDFNKIFEKLNQTSEFDSFQALQKVEKRNFMFDPTRYELWSGGKIIDEGITELYFVANVVAIDGEMKMEVKHSEWDLYRQLESSVIFDEFVTGNDRLQMITVPSETEHENMALQMLKMTYGPTRKSHNFKSNEPYCCNLFLKEGKLVKMTFSYNNPEKLLELYSD